MKLRHDPESRAIAGISSGGICAWTVAWERPDEFRKVLSWVGSFTNIASGKTRQRRRPQLRGPDPQDAQEADPRLPPGRRQRPRQRQRQLAPGQPADGQGPGSSPSYDYQFVYGQGFHSNRHGRAILPDSLRWLWRDYKPGEETKTSDETKAGK